MATFVRQCSQCGSVDNRMSWSSTEEAAKQGAFDDKWSCSSCAWTDFELVEADEAGQVQEAGQAQETATR
jgi:hypothetical protein